MPMFAPRISFRLLQTLDRVDDPTLPIAEINRRLGAEAWRLGLPRPSYQRIRVLVHQLRRIRLRKGPSTGEILFDIALRARPPTALVDHLSGVGIPRLRC
jgi:hypothetical protein